MDKKIIGGILTLIGIIILIIPFLMVNISDEICNTLGMVGALFFMVGVVILGIEYRLWEKN